MGAAVAGVAAAEAAAAAGFNIAKIDLSPNWFRSYSSIKKKGVFSIKSLSSAGPFSRPRRAGELILANCLRYSDICEDFFWNRLNRKI